MLKEEKPKKIKNGGYKSEDTNDLKRFIIILIAVIVFIVLAYFITRIFVTKDLFNEETKEVTPGTINYNNTIIGAMLSKPEEEYFIMCVDASVASSVYYLGLMNNYSAQEGALKVYLADLSNALNAKFVGETNNITENFDELTIATPTLIKVKKAKIVESYTDDESIAKALKVAQEEEK